MTLPSSLFPYWPDRVKHVVRSIGRQLPVWALLAAVPVFGQSDPNRGLWVGQVTLQYVNEVSVPLDASNVSIAPDPSVPTPTSDAAQLRLILHVNGSGQVSLLKDVAILNRTDASAGALETEEGDLVLVTDERLYSSFPVQPATRIATAVFDFGDDRATRGVNAVLDAAVTTVATSVFSSTQDLSTSAGRQAAADVAVALALDTSDTNSAATVVANADVAASFDRFMTDTLDSLSVDNIAGAADPVSEATAALAAATTLKSQSFYGDDRAEQMVQAVVGAVTNAPANLTTNFAHNAAASFADITNNYARFISGKLFEGTLRSAAGVASSNAVLSLPAVPRLITSYQGTNGIAPVLVTSPAHGLGNGDRIVISGSEVAEYNQEHLVTLVSTNAFTIPVQFSTNPPVMGQWMRSDAIRNALDLDPGVNQLRQEALRIQVARYRDSRASEAIAVLLDALVLSSATEALTTPGLTGSLYQPAVIAAGRVALKDNVARYPSVAATPTIDYSDFIHSSAFLNSAQVAAEAAAKGAILERQDNLLANPESVQNAARLAAVSALQDTYSSAARAVRNELPMTGLLGAGLGDPRFIWDIKQNGEAPLTAPALVAELFLPANHPTNPFRHRRHPDHTAGFDIIRRIRMDFDGTPSSPLSRAGYGVDRITGVYREEVTGLHKPLGPQKDIGLRVEGRFELNRISLIDTLNAR